MTLISSESWNKGWTDKFKGGSHWHGFGEKLSQVGLLVKQKVPSSKSYSAFLPHSCEGKEILLQVCIGILGGVIICIDMIPELSQSCLTCTNSIAPAPAGSNCSVGEISLVTQHWFNHLASWDPATWLTRTTLPIEASSETYVVDQPWESSKYAYSKKLRSYYQNRHQ